MHVLESVAERAIDIYCTSCIPCHIYTACELRAKTSHARNGRLPTSSIHMHTGSPEDVAKHSSVKACRESLENTFRNIMENYIA